MTVKIITDSTSYIPKHWVDELDINVISLNVSIEEDYYKETEISNEDFYRRIKESSKFPKSSQPELGELLNMIESEIVKGNEVLGIFLSSEMSGTYQSAEMVKQMVLDKHINAKIEILDSKSNCMEMGWQVVEAAEHAKNGQSLSECLEKAKNIMHRSRFIFAPKNLDYLKMGGRIGGASGFLGTLLNIVPILTVKDGKTDVITKVRTRKKALIKLLEIFDEDCSNFGLEKVIVHHIDAEELAKNLALELNTKYNLEVEIAPIGAVIGTHVGPGAIGLAYYTKKEMFR